MLVSSSSTVELLKPASTSLGGATSVSQSVVPVRHQIFIFRRASPVKTRPLAMPEINHVDQSRLVQQEGDGGRSAKHSWAEASDLWSVPQLCRPKPSGSVPRE